MTDEVLLAARGLTRSYGRQCALAGVDLTLRRGEVLGFLGLNGAGKTTTLQIVAGALAADSGSVEIAGHDLAAQPIAARRCLGYLPQVAPLWEDMRVDEYLGFCARVHGLGGAAAAAAIARARALCGLADAGQRLIRQLSGGYRQRVGIAQAVLHEPQVLVLDEPTTGLDPAQIRDVRELIRDLGRARAVIVSTHILSEVRALATRVAILHRGRVVHDAPMNDGRIVRACLRRPPAPARLAEVPGVERLQQDADGAWLLEGAALDPAALAVAAAREGWELTALDPDFDALERRFMQLTDGVPRDAAA